MREVERNLEPEDWKAHKEQLKAHRAEHRRRAPIELREAGIAFTEHNQGAHLIVIGGRLVNGVPERWDFWPGTGRWSHRGPPHIAGRGVASLIARLTTHKETEP